MRPSWHLDAKWLFGLACLAAIVVAGGLYSATKLTEHDPATGIFAGVMTTFAKEGDSSEGFDELQARAAANPDEDFTIEGVTLPVKGSELAGLSYDEAVDLVVARIADILYADGPDAVEQFFEDQPGAGSGEGSSDESDEFGLGPFIVLTQDSHDTVRRIFTFSLVPIVVLAVLLVLFSRRFGRLGSPGVVLAIGTAPFAILWFTVKQVTESTGGDGIEGALAKALSPTAGDVSSAFLGLFILGLGIVVVAAAGHVGFALGRRFRPIETPPEEDTAPLPEALEQPPHYTSKEGFSGHLPGASRSTDPGGVPQA